MLAQLTISNFAIVRELDIDFQQGMTAITGETGAGKSRRRQSGYLCPLSLNRLTVSQAVAG